MADPNPLAGMPLAESLANNMNESLQWMARMWGTAAAAPRAGAELFGSQSPLPPGLPSMLMPTLDPQELDKRISDLKTVEHWLDMNRALLHTTIQTLEMQRNAIVALQSMARSAQAGLPAAAPPPAGIPPETAGQARAEPAAAAAPLPFDPTQWWTTLQDQFARVAAAAAAAPEPDEPPAGAPPDPVPVTSRRAADAVRAPSEGKGGRKPSASGS